MKLISNRSNCAKVVFVSGNEDKVNDANQVLGSHFKLQVLRSDLIEIQGDPEEITVQKCTEAMKLTKESVIVEDSALCLDALGGMPGPYIKWFMKKLTPFDIHRLLISFDQFTASVVSTVALGIQNPDGTSQIHTFQTRVNGRIVEPRGSKGDRGGWDTCFQPDHQPHTYGEMDGDQRREHCARQSALNLVLRHLQAQ